MDVMNNEQIIVEQVAKGTITAKEATQILAKLNESSDYKFGNGSKVYIAHGIGAGTFGTFVKELDGGYAEVKSNAGDLSYIPLIFIQKTEQ